jgi:AMP nucleosidase
VAKRKASRKPARNLKGLESSKIQDRSPDKQSSLYKGNPFITPTFNRTYNNPKKAKIARDMLERYTGSAVSKFKKQIILTNFEYYIERFHSLCGTEKTRGSAMTVVHSDSADVTIVNFSIGSPMAALAMELISVVEPKAVLFLGMCGGLHRSLKKGDFIVPTAAIRDEGASIHFMPRQVPALPTFKIQKFVSEIVVGNGFDYRTGVIHTMDYRFWEFDEKFKAQLYEERALGIDMETATLFVAGFASKVPIGALLLVSDLPLKRGGIKTKKSASSVFKSYTDIHLEIGIKAMSEISEKGEHIRHYKW